MRAKTKVKDVDLLPSVGLSNHTFGELYDSWMYIIYEGIGPEIYRLIMHDDELELALEDDYEPN